MKSGYEIKMDPINTGGYLTKQNRTEQTSDAMVYNFAAVTQFYAYVESIHPHTKKGE